LNGFLNGHHGDRHERAHHFTFLAPGAGSQVVNDCRLDPTVGLQTQKVPMARRNAPTATGAAGGVNRRQECRSVR
jgi:hypothetical protein